MTRVFYASTLFGAMTLAAAVDAGLFGSRDERRLLIVSNNVAIPEITPGFEYSAGFEPLRSRFDDIVRWNEVIAPMHPGTWVPPATEAPMLSRLVVEHLGLQDGVHELVLESVAVAPARTIGMLLRDCPVSVYSDGLMSYGPTRDALAVGIGRRTERLLHLDLVPSLEPLLLREYTVSTVPVPAESFLDVVAELPKPEVGDDAGTPVILGQYLSRLGVLESREELALHDSMLDALAARGARRVIFRPHPAAGRTHALPLRRHAEQIGVELVVAEDGLPAETWFAAAQPSLVVSCFSTALLTAAELYGAAVATMGTELVLDRITPYQNSNRIPVTIVDAVVPRLRPDGTIADPPAVDVAQLVRAVGFCMQSTRLLDLRDGAAAYLAEHGRERYFTRRRLETVDLLKPIIPRTPSTERLARAISRATRR